MKKTTFNDLPHKFEAGTPNIVGGIALGSAIEWLAQFDMDEIIAYEQELLVYATEALSEIDGVKIYGESAHKCATISFLVKDLHPYDIGTLLNQQGIAVRTGHHCTQPIMDYYGIPGTIRISLSFYNTTAEIDLFITALNKAILMLS